MSDFELSIVPRSPRFKSPLQDSQGLASSSSPGFFHASSLPLASACSLCQDPDLSRVSVVTPQWEVSWTLLPGLSHLFLLRAFAYNNLSNDLANTACQCHKDRDHKPLALDAQPVIQEVPGKCCCWKRHAGGAKCKNQLLPGLGELGFCACTQGRTRPDPSLSLWQLL